jgi:hypothetical protein
MIMLELLYKYLNADDIKTILSSWNLNTSGSEPELYDRLEMAIRGMPAKEVLSSFPRNALLDICNDSGIEGHSMLSCTDEETIRKICSKVLVKERPKLDDRPWMR